MFPLMNFAMMGLTNPEMLASQMAMAGAGPEMFAPQLGLGQLAQPGMPMPDAAGQMAMTAPGQPQAAAAAPMELASTDPTIYQRFMSTVGQRFKNPNALAAIAATGQRESGFSPGNTFGTWDDVGAPAGGIMSWRAERLDALRSGREMAQVMPEDQGQYFISEAEKMGFADALENAKSPTEAMQVMNNTWRFKGYDNPNHPETQARFETANEFAPNFQAPADMGGVGSTIDFARAGSTEGATPPISPGGEVTQNMAAPGIPTGGGLDATNTGSSMGQVMQAGGSGAPASQPQSFGQKLANMGKGMAGKQTAPQQKEQNRASSHAPQVGGGFPRDPQAIQQMIALLGGMQGPPAVPSLASMINPKG